MKKTYSFNISKPIAFRVFFVIYGRHMFISISKNT